METVSSMRAPRYFFRSKWSRITVRWQREKTIIVEEKVTEDRKKLKLITMKGQKPFSCAAGMTVVNSRVCDLQTYTLAVSQLSLYLITFTFMNLELNFETATCPISIDVTKLCEGVLGGKIKLCRAGGKTKSHKRLKCLTLTAIFSDTSWMVTKGG